MNQTPNIIGFERLVAASIEAPKIIPFGSRFLGIHRPDSDIDIVLISPQFKNWGLYERNAIAKRAVAELDWPSDVFLRTPDEWQKRGFLQEMVQSQLRQSRHWVQLRTIMGRKVCFQEPAVREALRNAITIRQCVHRSPKHIELLQCTKCSSIVRIKVFACAVHGRCVLWDIPDGEIKTCRQCADFRWGSKQR